jgi:hypothetical protein
VISRPFLMVLVFGAALFKVSQAAWVEATGLAALFAGLLFLQLATKSPRLKPLAWCAFAVTGVSMVVVFLRMRTGV